MYRLLGFYTQNNMKAVYVLEELGVNYQFEFINLAKGENKTGDFLAINPVGKVPVLVHGEETLFESNTICRYVASVENSPLYPEDKLTRAKTDQWLDFFTNHLGRWVSTLFFQNIIKPMIGSEPDGKTCEEASEFMQQQFSIVDKHLESNNYFVGNMLTIADICAYAYIEQIELIKISIDEYPNLSRWYKEISAKPAIAEAKKKVKEAQG